MLRKNKLKAFGGQIDALSCGTASPYQTNMIVPTHLARENKNKQNMSAIVIFKTKIWLLENQLSLAFIFALVVVNLQICVALFCKFAQTIGNPWETTTRSIKSLFYFILQSYKTLIVRDLPFCLFPAFVFRLKWNVIQTIQQNRFIV